MSSISPADIIIVLLLVLSAAFAFLRGFVREFFGLAAWVGAGLVTAYTFIPARTYVRDQIEPPLLADALTGAAIFIGTLVLLLLIAHMITEGVRSSRFGMIDRSLGFIFGLFRGALVVCLAYMFLVWAMPEGRPEWVEKARLMPLVQDGVGLIRVVVPATLQEEGAALAAGARKKGEAAAGVKENLDTLTGEDAETGYPADERKALDGVIEGIE